MPFKTDAHGLAFKCNDIKMTGGRHTWGMKLSQLARQHGQVSIITYSLPSLDYVAQQLGRRPWSIDIIAHKKFLKQAERIKRDFPSIRIAVKDEVHSKVALISPETVIVSSANFGDSQWHETSMSVHSDEAYGWYFANVFLPLWDKAIEIRPRMSRVNKGKSK
jgi:hypothetical protein